MFSCSKNPKATNNQLVQQYVNHTQNQNRIRQERQVQMLRNIQPGEFAAQQQFQQQQMMRNMQNAGMGMKPGGLQRTAMTNMANNQK